MTHGDPRFTESSGKSGQRRNPPLLTAPLCLPQVAVEEGQGVQVMLPSVDDALSGISSPEAEKQNASFRKGNSSSAGAVREAQPPRPIDDRQIQIQYRSNLLLHNVWVEENMPKRTRNCYSRCHGTNEKVVVLRFPTHRRHASLEAQNRAAKETLKASCNNWFCSKIFKGTRIHVVSP